MVPYAMTKTSPLHGMMAWLSLAEPCHSALMMFVMTRYMIPICVRAAIARSKTSPETQGLRQRERAWQTVKPRRKQRQRLGCPISRVTHRMLPSISHVLPFKYYCKISAARLFHVCLDGVELHAHRAVRLPFIDAVYR